MTYLQVFSTALILSGLLFMTSTVGILFSVLFRTSNRAAGATLLVIACIEFGAIAAEQLLLANGSGMVKLGQTVIDCLSWVESHRSISACSALSSTLGPATVQRTVLGIATSVLIADLIIGSIAFSIAIYFAKRLKKVTDAGRSEQRQEISRESRRVVGEPIRWKEYRFHGRGWAGVGGRVFAYALATVGTVAALNHWKVKPADGWTALGLILIGVALIDLARMATQIFGAERREGTLATLMMTTHRSGDLFWKKLFGLVPAILVTVSVLILAEAIRPDFLSDWLGGYWAWGVFSTVSIAAWLQYIVLFSLDFPSISTFTATVGLIVSWIATFVLALVWLTLAGADSGDDRTLIVMSYFLGLATVGAHIASAFRVSDAAAK